MKIRTHRTSLPLALVAMFATRCVFAQTSGLVYEETVVTSLPNSFGTLGYANAPGASFGKMSTTGTIEGYTITELASNNTRGGPRTFLTVVGFSSNPSSSWLSSISCNGTTITPANQLSYIYASGQASWEWASSSALLSFPMNTAVSCQVAHTGTSGWIRPKFVVVGLTYAPPGSRSSATYVNGFMSGTGSSNASSFTSATNVNVKVTGGAGLFGLVEGTTTGSFSAGWVQEQDSSSSVTVAEQNSTGLIVPGPASSGLGVDHDYDTIYVWLNPAVFVEFGASNAYQSNYAYDTRDPISGMDVIPITAGQIKGTQAIPAAVQARLNRTWDSALAAPTFTDYLTMLFSDPFEFSSSYNPNTDSGHRYELPESGSPAQPTDLVFNYVPVPAGGQATGQTYTSTYTSTSTTGQGAKNSQSTSYSIDTTASANFIAKVSTTFSVSQQYTTATQWSKSITDSNNQAANFTIYPPLASDDYTGLTAIQVWKDNVYGTFMFYPE